MEIKGRIALVTGAASGIGRACAIELLNQGAKVKQFLLKRSILFLTHAYLSLSSSTKVSFPGREKSVVVMIFLNLHTVNSNTLL